MNRLEQSQCFLRQYLKSRKETPWLSHMPEVENRARECLQDLDGIAGDWYVYRPYCSYHYPQTVQA